MRHTVRPKKYHLPPEVQDWAVGHSMAREDAQRWSGGVVMHVTLTNKVIGWCWRHLQVDQRVLISWVVEWPSTKEVG